MVHLLVLIALIAVFPHLSTFCNIFRAANEKKKKQHYRITRGTHFFHNIVCYLKLADYGLSHIKLENFHSHWVETGIVQRQKGRIDHQSRTDFSRHNSWPEITNSKHTEWVSKIHQLNDHVGCRFSRKTHTHSYTHIKMWKKIHENEKKETALNNTIALIEHNCIECLFKAFGVSAAFDCRRHNFFFFFSVCFFLSLLIENGMEHPCSMLQDVVRRYR